jgi:hypothetical protein
MKISFDLRPPKLPKNDCLSVWSSLKGIWIVKEGSLFIVEGSLMKLLPLVGFAARQL